MNHRDNRISFQARSFQALQTVILACVLCESAVAGAILSNGELEDQPNNQHSFLVEMDGGMIKDTLFADSIKRILREDNGTGETKIRNATFLFQSCFGGGMLDDLQTALGTEVKWLGASASRHDKVAYKHPSKGRDNYGY